MSTEVPDEYISGRILKNPERTKKGTIIKGAIILSQIDHVIQSLPYIKDYFYTIERRSWRGLNESVHADIKLIEDLSFWDETIKKFPNAICLDIGPADFVDTESFYPTGEEKKYTGIQISSWDSFKRPFLFVSACALLPHRNFIKIGHFVRNGNPEEIAIRDQCLELTEKSGANIVYPYGSQNDNHLMPKSKKEVNKMLNSVSIGILTSQVEGINRFKMECLSANIPFLVAKDAAYPTKKHINDSTGKQNSSTINFVLDSQPPRILTLSDVVEIDRATISFTTDENTNYTLYYGTTTAVILNTSSNTFSSSQSVILTTLSEDTVYYYNITLTDILNHYNTTIQYTFKTGTTSGGGCSDTCASGETEKSCVNSTTITTRTCGNYDEDSCREWSAWTQTACSLGCVNNNCVGACTPDWQCSAWSECFLNNTNLGNTEQLISGMIVLSPEEVEGNILQEETEPELEILSEV